MSRAGGGCGGCCCGACVSPANAICGRVAAGRAAPWLSPARVVERARKIYQRGGFRFCDGKVVLPREFVSLIFKNDGQVPDGIDWQSVNDKLGEMERIIEKGQTLGKGFFGDLMRQRESGAMDTLGLVVYSDMKLDTVDPSSDAWMKKVFGRYEQEGVKDSEIADFEWFYPDFVSKQIASSVDDMDLSTLNRKIVAFCNTAQRVLVRHRLNRQWLMKELVTDLESTCSKNGLDSVASEVLALKETVIPVVFQGIARISTAKIDDQEKTTQATQIEKKYEFIRNISVLIANAHAAMSAPYMSWLDMCKEEVMKLGRVAYSRYRPEWGQVVLPVELQRFPEISTTTRKFTPIKLLDGAEVATLPLVFSEMHRMHSELSAILVEESSSIVKAMLVLRQKLQLFRTWNVPKPAAPQDIEVEKRQDPGPKCNGPPPKRRKCPLTSYGLEGVTCSFEVDTMPGALNHAFDHIAFLMKRVNDLERAVGDAKKAATD